MDLAPTILQLMQVEHDAVFLAGRDLLTSPVTSRNIDPDDPYGRAVLAFLNSQHLSSKDSEILYSLSSDGISQIEFSDHITDIEFKDGTLSFNAIGNDPYLILPRINLDDPGVATLFLNVVKNKDSIAAVYYSPDPQPEFSEDNTLLLDTFDGENGLAFSLSELNNDSRIRIDPGDHEGRYILQILEIRS